MTHLTPEREQEIRERADAATPGPWRTYNENPGDDYAQLIDIAADLEDTGHGYRCRRYIGQLESGQIDNDPSHRDWDADQDNEQSSADAEFIARSREDVPALLAEIDRLRGEQREVADEIARFGIYGSAKTATAALVRRADELVTENTELRARVTVLQAGPNRAQVLRAEAKRLAERANRMPVTARGSQRVSLIAASIALDERADVVARGGAS